MKTFLSLRPTVRAYVAGVVTVGALVLGFSAHALLARPIGSDWLLLAGLTILTDRERLKGAVGERVAAGRHFIRGRCRACADTPATPRE